MASFRFIGDPRCGGHGPENIALYGHTFSRTEWTEVEDDLAERCARHTHLEVRREAIQPDALYVRSWATHDDETPSEAPRKRGRPPKVKG